MAPIKKPLNRTVRRQIQTPYGPLIATLTADGVTLHAPRKRKGLSLSYEAIAKAALANHGNLHWPVDLQDKPLAQLHHLGRRAL